MKTQIYNLIILDESGSMYPVWEQTIGGCNETINTIKASQDKFGETQEHFVSIYAFQSNPAVPSRYLVKNIPAEAAKHIDNTDYQPGGGTPLFDAVGSTLVDLKTTVFLKPDAIGSVTIITDGAENSSTHFTAQKVAKMIEELKEMGWNFNFIGANIDVNYYATMLHIDNAMAFTQTKEGTKAMFEKERRSRMAYNERLHDMMDSENYACMPVEEKMNMRKKAAKGYFDEA